jgi:hypothetical protein
MAKLKSVYFRNFPLRAHCRYCTMVSVEIANSPSTIISAMETLSQEFNADLTV